MLSRPAPQDDPSLVLGTFCGNVTPTAWLRSSGRALTLRLRTDADARRDGLGFDVGYFSDRANDHCGAAEHGAPRGRAARLRAPSFAFTDGSRRARCNRAMAWL